MCVRLRVYLLYSSLFPPFFSSLSYLDRSRTAVISEYYHISYRSFWFVLFFDVISADAMGLLSSIILGVELVVVIVMVMIDI